MTTTPAPALITGGTGRTVARSARRLGDRGAPVRVASRRAPAPDDRHGSGCWVRGLDRAPAGSPAHTTRAAATGIRTIPATQQVGP